MTTNSTQQIEIVALTSTNQRNSNNKDASGGQSDKFGNNKNSRGEKNLGRGDNRETTNTTQQTKIVALTSTNQCNSNKKQTSSVLSDKSGSQKQPVTPTKTKNTTPTSTTVLNIQTKIKKFTKLTSPSSSTTSITRISSSATTVHRTTTKRNVSLSKSIPTSTSPYHSHINEPLQRDDRTSKLVHQRECRATVSAVVKHSNAADHGHDEFSLSSRDSLARTA
jgi:hypothetical protein